MSIYKKDFLIEVSNFLKTVEHPIVVEIGTRQGEWIAQLFEHSQHQIVFAIDPWPKRQTRSLFDSFLPWYENVKPVAFKQVFPLRGGSEEWGQVWPEDLNPHVVYVDGSHRYGHVLQDWKLWWPKLEPGGVMYFHDTNEPDVKRAFEDLVGNLSYRTHYWGPGKVEMRSIWKV